MMPLSIIIVFCLKKIIILEYVQKFQKKKKNVFNYCWPGAIESLGSVQSVKAIGPVWRNA